MALAATCRSGNCEMVRKALRVQYSRQESDLKKAWEGDHAAGEAPSGWRSSFCLMSGRFILCAGSPSQRGATAFADDARSLQECEVEACSRGSRSAQTRGKPRREPRLLCCWVALLSMELPHRHFFSNIPTSLLDTEAPQTCNGQQ